MKGIGEYGNSIKLRQLVLSEFRETEISRSLVNLSSLQKLQLYDCSDLKELPESLGKLVSLQELNLFHCKRLKQLPAGFGKLKALTTLNLSGCCSLQELPIDFSELSSLQYLKMRNCRSLQELPINFGELSSLHYLNLHTCDSLQKLPSNFESLTSLQCLNLHSCSELLMLPERLGSLPSLNYLEFRGCKKITSLPHSLGQLTSLLASYMSLDGCSSLRELPKEISWLATCKRIYLHGCSSLKAIPNGFSNLICLEFLNMSGCRSLSSLPDGFGKLTSLRELYLSHCEQLKELCSDFHCLAALKVLKLSRCSNLSQLPDCFGQLGCLEELDLSDCCSLEKLCHDFHRLPSLITLNLSNCEKLGVEWMDKLRDIPSLWRVDIRGNKMKIYQWVEMKSKENKCNFVADTGFSRKPLILEAVILKVFDKEGLLIDTQNRPFYSSSLDPYTPPVLIIDGSTYSASSETWKLLGKNLQWLEANTKLAFHIIYVGRHYNALTSVLLLGNRILSYTPHTSGTSSFPEKLFSTFYYEGIGVFRNSADGLGEFSLKCLSAWEDISYVLKEVTFLARTPRDSNIELLRELLVTEETDFLLLHDNQQVKLKVDNLKGKVVLLLIAYNNIPISQGLFSVLEDVYAKMRGSQAEVVCITKPRSSSFPWPVVPNPRLISGKLQYLIRRERRAYYNLDNTIMVVDEAGKISCEDALPNILRWGVEAYPFSKAREEELIKAEWEGLRFNSQSSLEFVFQNVELVQLWVKEVISRGEIMLVCVGLPSKMLEFASELNFALAKLENVVQVLYVGTDGDTFKKEDKDYEMKRKEMYNITTMSSPHVHKFWARLTGLLEELSSQGVGEKTMQVRRIVLGFLSVKLQSDREQWKSKELEGEKGKGISIMVVDEKGKMISGRGKEVVMLLCQTEKEEHHKLLAKIKIEGFSKIVKQRWRYGIIHDKHDPQHPLVKLHFDKDGRMFFCNICCSKIDSYEWYICSICETYEICKKCCEC